jgi:hypothetical protein
VDYNSGAPSGFFGMARSEIAYHTEFEVYGGNVDLNILSSLLWGTTIFYSLHDNTLGVQVTASSGTNSFSSTLLEDHIYEFSMYSSLESPGDPFGPVLDLAFASDAVVNSVPEPTAIFLLSAGLASLGFIRKMKKT